MKLALTVALCIALVLSLSVSFVPLSFATTPTGQIDYYTSVGTCSSTWSGATGGSAGSIPGEFSSNIIGGPSTTAIVGTGSICIKVTLTGATANTMYTISSNKMSGTLTVTTDSSGDGSNYALFTSTYSDSCTTVPIKMSPESPYSLSGGQIAHVFVGTGAYSTTVDCSVVTTTTTVTSFTTTTKSTDTAHTTVTSYTTQTSTQYTTETIPTTTTETVTTVTSGACDPVGFAPNGVVPLHYSTSSSPQTSTKTVTTYTTSTVTKTLTTITVTSVTVDTKTTQTTSTIPISTTTTVPVTATTCTTTTPSGVPQFPGAATLGLAALVGMMAPLLLILRGRGMKLARTA